MKFHVGQRVRMCGPFFHGRGKIAKITNINKGMEYPIRILQEDEGWSETCTAEGLLFDDEPKDSPNSVYIEPLTKLERLLLGLE